MTLNRSTLLRENAALKAEAAALKAEAAALKAEAAALKAEAAALKRRNEALDLQRLLLLDQIIEMQRAADAAGLQFDFTHDNENLRLP